jgi:predicted nucleic acid-binding protein
MRHVFVETNWVVAYAAPAHHRNPDASELFDRAASGEIKLSLPVICIAEARRPIFERFQSRNEADRVRQFLLWARDAGIVNAAEDEATRRVLDRMEGRVRADLERLDETFDNLKAADGIEIFNLTQEMLERCADLSYLNLDLKPFDQAILAAILVRGERLLADGVDETAFCELDSDLQPWDKGRNRKERLAGLYDKARIWVYRDFLLQAPAKPDDWLRTAGNNP